MPSYLSFFNDHFTTTTATTKINYLTLDVFLFQYKLHLSVTIHVHQRDVTAELAALAKNKRITDANDFEWLKQARFYWRDGIADEISPDGKADAMPCYAML